MVTQNYTISTVKNAVPPKVKMSQYDSASRTITFTVVDGSGSEVSLTGKAVTVEGTRIDGHAFTVECTVSGATATFTETVDMTNQAGDHPAELVVRENGGRLGTMNFIIAVEPAAMDEDADVSPEDKNLFEQLYAKVVSGSPVAVDTVAEMTNTDGVYLYTGNESGYTKGYWYYYDGSAWVAGGAYGSGATDKTLTLSDVAADAKVVGDYLDEISDGMFQHGLYGAKWDRTSNLLTRTRDAVGITTDTTNFCHLGSINENYSNPFDDIYPWSDMFVCDVDLTKYRTGQYTLKQCITAVYGDPDFTYVGTDDLFVGRYRPEFWHKSIEDADGNVEFLVSQFARPGYKHSPEAIDGVGYCVDVGNSKVTSGSGVPLTNIACSTIHTRAKNSGFTLTDIDALDSQIILYLVEYANWNAQAAIGDGCDNCYRNNSADVVSNVTVSDGVTVFDVPNTTALLNLLDAGTQLSFGTSSSATTYKAIVASRDGTTVTLDRDIAITDGMILSVHGFSSCEFDILDESIGNASGYIGTRHHANAYYRGASLYANRYRYILGCYRQTQTNHIWICPDGVDPDDYDALNTSVHEDTGIALPTVTTAGWQTLGSDAKVVGGLSAFLAVGDESGSSSSPVGDQQYIPLPTTSNTVLFFGCNSLYGWYCGVAGCYWYLGSGVLSWYCGAAPILKSSL